MILQVNVREFLDITGSLVVNECKSEFPQDKARLMGLRKKLNEQFSAQVVAVEAAGVDNGKNN